MSFKIVALALMIPQFCTKPLVFETLHTEKPEWCFMPHNLLPAIQNSFPHQACLSTAFHLQTSLSRQLPPDQINNPHQRGAVTEARELALLPCWKLDRLRLRAEDADGEYRDNNDAMIYINKTSIWQKALHPCYSKKLCYLRWFICQWY